MSLKSFDLQDGEKSNYMKIFSALLKNDQVETSKNMVDKNLFTTDHFAQILFNISKVEYHEILTLKTVSLLL